MSAFIQSVIDDEDDDDARMLMRELVAGYSEPEKRVNNNYCFRLRIPDSIGAAHGVENSP